MQQKLIRRERFQGIHLRREQSVVHHCLHFCREHAQDKLWDSGIAKKRSQVPVGHLHQSLPNTRQVWHSWRMENPPPILLLQLIVDCRLIPPLNSFLQLTLCSGKIGATNRTNLGLKRSLSRNKLAQDHYERIHFQRRSQLQVSGTCQAGEQDDPPLPVTFLLALQATHRNNPPK